MKLHVAALLAMCIVAGACSDPTLNPAPAIPQRSAADPLPSWSQNDRDSHIGQLVRGLDEAPKRGRVLVGMKRVWRIITLSRAECQCQSGLASGRLAGRFGQNCRIAFLCHLPRRRHAIESYLRLDFGTFWNGIESQYPVDHSEPFLHRRQT